MRIYNRGFTLIELLVVIAIIAALAAILFPVFTSARAASRKAQCLSNMRQIAYAYRMYLGDYNDAYPSNHFGANLFLVEPYLRQKRYKVGSETWADSVWLCPSARKDMWYPVRADYWTRDVGTLPPWGDPSKRIKVFNSYALNDDVTTTTGRRPRKLNDVTRPSKTVLFGEGCYYESGRGSSPEDLGTAPTAVHPTPEPWEVQGWCRHFVPGSASELHPWHETGANFMFVDLHVAFHSAPPELRYWRVSR